MPSQAGRPKRRLLPAWLSLAWHGVLLALLLVLEISPRAKVVQRPDAEAVALLETAGGSHAIPLLLPKMPTAAHTREPSPDEETKAKTMLPVKSETPLKTSGGGTPPTPHAGDGSANAPRGNGSDDESVKPAFPVFSPRPPVTDRSLLPATQQQIVIDVKVDALGAVIGENLLKGLGNELDKIVLDTVKTWRFQPATVNGKPVPTEAELIFPFDPRYPITPS